MHHLLDSVEKCVRQSSSLTLKRKLPSAESHEKKRGPQRGADKRKSYSFSFRANVLTQCDVETNKPDAEIAFENGIGKSSLCSWKKSRKIIFEKAAKEHSRLLTKGRRSKKHDAVFDKLIPKFRAARGKGQVVSFAWLYTHASKIHKELNPDSTRRLSPSVVVAFKRKYHIKMRRVQCRKQKPRTDGVSALLAWHAELREGVIRTGPNLPFYDPKFGRYSPDRRFNVDQVPMPFAMGVKQTYEESCERGEQRKRRV